MLTGGTTTGAATLGSVAARPRGTSLWIIDPGYSSVQFAISHLGIGRVRGTFRDVSGLVELDEQDPTRSTVAVEMEPKSIDTGQALRDMHLRGPEFFDVQAFPTIRFRSARVEEVAPRRLRVDGELTLRGVTGPVTLEATSRGRAVDAYGCPRHGFSASAAIDRRDFGLGWNQDLPCGGRLLGDEVRISLELELVRSNAPPDAA